MKVLRYVVLADTHFVGRQGECRENCKAMKVRRMSLVDTHYVALLEKNRENCKAMKVLEGAPG